MSNIRAVADLAGVSVATVSRTLQQPDLVSPKTRAKVTSAINKLDYKPNLLAVKFRSGKTHNIVVLVPTVANVFFARVIRGMQDAAAAEGYALLLVNTMGDDDTEEKYARMVQTSQADGVVQLRAFNPFPEAPSDCDELLPMVNACETLDAPNCPTVSLDNRRAATAMTEHLIALGHSHIAMVKGPKHSPLTRERMMGFKDALRAANLQYCEELMFAGDFTLHSGYEAADRLLSQNYPISAVFCENDEMALGAICRFKEAGLRVPEDISVSGFDNIAFANYSDPPLTTIAQPAEEFGETAINLLIDVLKGKTKRAMKVILPFDLVTRKSTGPAPEKPVNFSS
ncbi:MAG: LacI family DNA-binding transcriptional regulator [Alteromonadaceae bacterium]|nr:LacI family DNA-binding transcriptional regulator [Alteromonadaceae bacterium]